MSRLTTSAAPLLGERPSWPLITLGVLLPLGAIAFEFFTRVCADAFFDPLPTFWHVLLTLSVPLVNLRLWLSLRRTAIQPPSKLAWANGFALGVAWVYGLLLLAPFPSVLAGSSFYKFGLVPLAPLLAGISALLLRRYWRGRLGCGARLPGLWLGAALGASAVALCTLPVVLTKAGLQLASSDSPTESLRGIRLLRIWGQESVMLQACYGRGPRAGEGYSWGNPVDSKAARAIYYQVTGRAFNAASAARHSAHACWKIVQPATQEAESDEDAMGGASDGLLLVSSRQEASIEPESALAYLEWTMELRNDSPLAREVRAQIALPPRAVVSRLTWWIGGQEHKALFGACSQLQKDYQARLKSQQDALLVTMCGTDHIRLQCFPVAPRGGLIKVRLGITAPLTLANAENGFLRCPYLLDRNFMVAETFRHSVWLSSRVPLEPLGRGLRVEEPQPGAFRVHGEVLDQDLAAPSTSVRAPRARRLDQVWTVDKRVRDGHIVRQIFSEKRRQPPQRLVLVVDASAAMREFVPLIAQSLSALPRGLELAVVLARDGCYELFKAPLDGGGAAWQQAAERVRGIRCIGGHDNVPALVQAWELAAESAAGTVLWIHGPQPVLLDSVTELRQKLAQPSGCPLLIETQMVPGPNRIVEELDGLPTIRTLARFGSLGTDLQRLFFSWREQEILPEVVRERVLSAHPPQANRGRETSWHLLPLWALDEVARLCAAGQSSAAAQLATVYELVSPVSSAGLLEPQRPP